jgi:hypothetical protein
VIALALTMALALAAQATADVTCVPLESDGRLRAGQAFSASLPGGLEFRLAPDGNQGRWGILVGPRDRLVDYASVVSRPLQAGPQRVIGASEGVSARDSATFTRLLRFVLNEEEYAAALEIQQEGPASEGRAQRLEQLGRGTITLQVTAFTLDRAGGLAWIAFTGDACAPARP